MIGFFQSARDWLLNQDVNSGFEQGTGYGAMRLSRDSEADRVNFTNERMPVGCRWNAPFFADRTRALIVNVTDTNELRFTFGGQRGVDARVLPPEVSDADYRSS